MKKINNFIGMASKDIKGVGPDPMTAAKRKAFFDFYKKNKSRSLFGFFLDLKRSEVNKKILSKYLKNKKEVNCLIVGCSYWANPLNLSKFVSSFNNKAKVNVVALDVMPEALEEAVAHGVSFLPLLVPAQKTPFLDAYFDIVVADGLLNCCGFKQHEPIVKEISRIAKSKSVILLGLSYSANNIVVNSVERSMAVYARPLKSFKGYFQKYGFDFPEGSSYITLFEDGRQIKIDNCLAIKR